MIVHAPARRARLLMRRSAGRPYCFREFPRQIAVGGSTRRHQSALQGARAKGAEVSTVSRGDDSRIAQTAVHAYVASGDPEGPGVYLTNEVFLYRVVGIVAENVGETVELEDCYSLAIARVPIDDFHRRRLRVVTAAPVGD
jgi:hypothetical protein